MSDKSSVFRAATQREGNRPFNSVRLKEFRDYVEKRRPDLAPWIDHMNEKETKEFSAYKRGLLRKLAVDFEAGVIATTKKNLKVTSRKTGIPFPSGSREYSREYSRLRRARKLQPSEVTA